MDLIDLLSDLNIENKTNEFKGIIEEWKTKEGASKEDKWLKTFYRFNYLLKRRYLSSFFIDYQSLSAVLFD